MLTKSPRKSPQANARSGGSNQLRIIGGQWRGRKLSFPDVNGLRPTGDRIRETLFNWLQQDVPGAQVLDLFAGSGALGLETLSRGAEFCLLLEKDTQAARFLAANLELLKATQGKLLQVDSLSWLKAGRPVDMPSFDLVFIDPPFSLNLWSEIIDALEGGNWLSEGAAIYLESPRDKPLALPSHWRLHRDKQAGQVSYRLCYRELALGGEPETD